MMTHLLCSLALALAAEPGGDLSAHWPLYQDCLDASGNRHHGANRGVTFENGWAVFDGRSSHVEVAPDSIPMGTNDFTLSAWIQTDDQGTDVPGDILGKFDPTTRRGFNLLVQNFAGVTSSQSNWGNVLFGIDWGSEPIWTDRGRPGNAAWVAALTVFQGSLFAGTYEPGPEGRGKVYRFLGGGDWEDCGNPDGSNSVLSLAVHQGRLFAGTGRYRAGGSALPDSPNQTPGGHVFRYEGGKRWSDCGGLGDADTVYCMGAFAGRLYAIPIYHQGLYRFDGERTWTLVGSPGRRLMSMGVFNGEFFLAGNEGNKQGAVHTYQEPSEWSFAGGQAGVDQVYSFAVYGGELFAGTWPEAGIFRYGGERTWWHAGRLGEELETMGMAVYNGKLYAGSLPLAEVYRFDGGTNWTPTGRLDWTQDVKYRRAWSMAVYDGSLFCGVLPSGHVHSLSAGVCAGYDHDIGSGPCHVVAVRDGNRARLFVNGKPASEREAARPERVDLGNSAPFSIGRGSHDFFHGKMRDIRVYPRALSAEEILDLHRRESR